jgi:hypothetical protein
MQTSSLRHWKRSWLVHLKEKVSMTFVKVFVVPTLFVAVGSACSPSVQTQQQRLSYVQDTNDGQQLLQKGMNCNDVRLKFRVTRQVGINSYDVYDAEGCGRRSEYVTQVSQQSVGGGTTVTSYHASLAAPEAEFRKAAEAQLRKTAGFDLDCKDLAFTTLQAVIEEMGNTWQGTIGVAGCGKKATYLTGCQLRGVDDIVCVSRSNAGASAQ